MNYSHEHNQKKLLILSKKLLLLILNSAFLILNCNAQNWDLIIKGCASDRAAEELFGYKIAISGDYAIVGVSLEDEDTNGGNTMSSAGSAYIFKNTNGVWEQQQKIVASDRAANDLFGGTVAINGDYIIVGAYGEDENASGGVTLSGAGSAYIFKLSSGVWTQYQKIVASDRAVNDGFGTNVAISGDYAVIGAASEDEDATGGATLSNAGSAYVFKLTGGVWAQQQKIVVSDRGINNYFGANLAIDGNYILAGVSFDSENAQGTDTMLYAGSAYIFIQVGGVWTQQQKIVASNRETDDRFGYSISLSGDYAIIGSPNKNDTSSIDDVGCAYIFKQSGGIWSEHQIILASDRMSMDYFGTSVSINGVYAIIGAKQSSIDNFSWTDPGAAYIFKLSGGQWNEYQKIVSNQRRDMDYFGSAVSISGNYAIVGSPNEDEDAQDVNTLSNSGSVYFFGIADCSSTLNLQPESGTVFGWLASASSTGNPSLSYYWNWGDGNTSTGANPSHTYSDTGYYTICVTITDGSGCSDTYCDTKPGIGSVNVVSTLPGHQNWEQINKSCASDRAVVDKFGSVVAISGDYAIVGVPDEDENASGGGTLNAAGSAYIFKQTGGVWVQQQKIVASDRDSLDYFGSSVAISGDYAFVGAPSEDQDALGGATMTYAGSVYIFKQTGGVWTQYQKIVAADRGIGDRFGNSLAVDGDYLLSGAYKDAEDANGLNPNSLVAAGSAYIFKLTGGVWTQQQKIVASDRQYYNLFADKVAISGDYALIGDQNNTFNVAGGGYLTTAGAAYIFKQTGGIWAQQQKIVAADRAIGDRFGCSVGISGDYAIIGAYQQDEDVNGGSYLAESGSAYIFKQTNGTWAQHQMIVNSDREYSNKFGYSVAIDGNYAIVGDDHFAGYYNDFGSAYIYKLNNEVWTQHQKIMASDFADGDNFGLSVAINASYAIVGAPDEDEDINNANTLLSSGSVYFFGTACSAGFTLYPDTVIEHNWFLIPNTTGTQPLSYFWEWGDGNTSTGSNPSHIYSVEGNYNICLTITDANNCVASYCDSSTYIYKTEIMISVNVVNQLPVGIEETENNFVKVYPNPTSSSLTIETGQGKGIYQLQDVSGKIILQGSINAARYTLDISILAKGIYVLSITDGDKQAHKKIVKE